MVLLSSKKKTIRLENVIITGMLLFMLVFVGVSMMFNKVDDLLVIIVGFLFIIIAGYVALNFYDITSEVETDGF